MLSTCNARSAARPSGRAESPAPAYVLASIRRIGRDESDLAQPCFLARLQARRSHEVRGGFGSNAMAKVVTCRGPKALSPAAPDGKGGLDGLAAETMPLRLR
jgi:hypothetical protein